ncbi:RNA-binding protein 2-like [Bidens hawaiensis]|uniref:RNA-binding protein 2-like n=1 Tax=Bidens hawaiensis TaxID=980011 RepID=UPI004049CE00
MTDSYWKYAEARHQHQPPLHSLAGKRPRPDYDVSGGRDFPSYLANADARGTYLGGLKDSDTIAASYLHGSHFPPYSGDLGNRSLMGMGPPETRKVGDAGLLGMRPEIPLPSDASSTLFVEGLPSDCSRREVSHIFRPFVGYKEVRLVPKGSRHSSGDPFMLCFVDFESPAEAATAKDALKGYKFDEHDRDSAILRMQFARTPGNKAGGAGRRGRR